MEQTPKYLVCVDGDFGEQGHNKFYKMTPDGTGGFLAEWGRVGGSTSSKTYPMSKWSSTYSSKLKKGYVDRSHLMTDIIEDSKVENKSEGKDAFSVIKNISVREIIKRLFDYSNKVIQSSYRVTSEQVTQAMVDEAQRYIDYLSNNYTQISLSDFNEYLNKIFITIPRKMRSVKDYLAKKNDDFANIIQREQDLLDTMRGQVYKKAPKVEAIEEDTPIVEEVSILDKMGIIMEDATDADVEKIKKAMGDASNKFYKAWRVTNKETEENYQKFVKENNIGNVKLTCHGSRNQNWFNILKTGLKIRPAGAILTGSLFGYGLYYSNPDLWHGVAKSIGYTSLGGYWTQDYQNCGFIAFFETALGDSYDVYSFGNEYNTFDLKKLKNKNPNAWHLWAHGQGHRNNGSTLINDEIIVYDDRQTTIRYLVEIR